MRILYLAHRLPYPPVKGDKIRTFHVLDHLAARHDVTCACFLDPPSDRAHLPALRERCRQVIAQPLGIAAARCRALHAAAGRRSASIAYYDSPAMRAALGKCGTFDAVVAFSACMGPHALHVPARRRILDLCDLDSRKWAAYADVCGPLRGRFYRREAAALQRFEEQLYAAFDATLLISPTEAADWNLPDRSRLHVVGNGVHTPPRSPLPGDGLVGFVGDMGYLPNQDGVRYFLEEIWPQVRRAVPGSRFAVAGRNPPRWLQAHHGRDRVSILGAIPDVAVFLAECQVVTAPLRLARGVQNKVLEAMAAGRPVVAAPPAAAGIEAAADEHLWVAKDAVDHAAALIALLSDPARAAQLGARAAAHVAATYRWDDRLKQLDVLLSGEASVVDAASSSRSTPPSVTIGAA